MMKTYFQLLDRWMPTLAAQQVYRVMSQPRVRKLRDFEERILAQAKSSRRKFRDFTLQVYEWGRVGDPVVFLVHGWEGQAGNFGGMVDLLVDKGWHVIAFDGPSHGKSSRGNTSMFDFGQFVAEMMRQHLPRVIISHSFGSVTTAFALRENPNISIDQWIMVTTPHNFKDRVKQIRDYLGISDQTLHLLTQKIEESTGESLNQLNMDAFGASLANVEQILIVHSKDDKIIPIEWARRTQRAIAGAEMIELDQLGHYRILWSPELKVILKEKLLPPPVFIARDLWTL
ncbi:MAG: alpha/beta hydrolase [Bacteroidota bacterium]